MADFVQTMKDWRKMCKALGSVCCDGCKLHTDGNDCVAVYEGEMDYAKVEKAVTDWAAENPEPVYPTWWEYLTRIHVIFPAMGDFQKCVDDLATTPIPADIAQKLGIDSLPKA